VSRRQIPGLYPDTRGHNAREWLDAAALVAPVDAHAPTPAEGVPTVRVPPVLWRVTEVYRGTRADAWDVVEDGDAPAALSPKAAAVAWASEWWVSSAVRVRVRSDRGESDELDVEITYRATRRVLP
jgi:hypothetical protein